MKPHSEADDGTAIHITPQQCRENPDPVERSAPVPWVLLAMTAALVIFGVYYIADSSLETPASWGDDREAGELSGGADRPATLDGAVLYANFCAACHQPGGQGLPGTFPPLASSEWVNGRDTTVAAIVLHGVSGPLEVRGVTYQGLMPAFKDRLGDAEVAALLTFLRAQWGNTAAAVSEKTAQATRQLHAGRTEPFIWKKDLPDHE